MQVSGEEGAHRVKGQQLRVVAGHHRTDGRLKVGGHLGGIGRTC